MSEEKIAKSLSRRKAHEGITFACAEAITDYLQTLPEELLGFQFMLLIIDRRSGDVKYISDLKDKVATVKMFQDMLTRRLTDLSPEELKELADKNAPQDVTAPENETQTEQTEPTPKDKIN